MSEPIEQTEAAPLPPPNISSYFKIKWYVDVAIVVFTSWFTVPLVLLFMLLTKLTSKGPVIYKQVRCCQGGKPFNMYKIRSMVTDAETGKGAVWAKQDDVRITPVGKIMRKLHIDEMPQIWNVLRGEMQVIGPRPERPEFVEKLNADVPGYEYRTLVKPGLTGYAQINLPPDAGLEDVHQKLVLDLEYLEKASPWFDFLILCGTIKIPLGLLGIRRNPADSPWADKVGLLDDHESVHLDPQTAKPPETPTENTDAR